MTAAAASPATLDERRFASTLAQLRQRLQEYDTDRAAERLQSAVVRGAAAGVALRGGLHLASYLAGLLLRLAARRARGGGKQSGRPPLRELLKDTARWGAFLGSFSGIFVLADELIAMLGGRRRTRAWRALAAGGLAGPSILLAGPRPNTSLALYVFVRGLVLLVRCGNLPGHCMRRWLAPTRWVHGDVALMCLSTAQIGYSWIMLPSTLPPSFTRFLNKHGGKPLHIYDAVRELAGRQARGLPAAPLASLAGSELAGFSGEVPCAFLHPGLSCTAHSIAFLPQGYLRALPVYFPVYLIPAILVHRKRLVQPSTAPQLWRKVGLGVLRSSLFLSLYCTLAWRGVCGGFNAAGRSTGDVIAASCWTGGLAVLVEKKSRRMELALYCLSRAAESFALCVGAWGWVSPRMAPRRIDVLLFSLATAFICHCYSDHFGQRRNVFRTKYLTVFDFVLGNTGFKSAQISHQPSNVDLLLQLESRLERTGLIRSVRSLTGLASLVRGGSQSADEDSDSSDEPVRRSRLPAVRSVPVLRGPAANGPAAADPP